MSLITASQPITGSQTRVVGRSWLLRGRRPSIHLPRLTEGRSGAPQQWNNWSVWGISHPAKTRHDRTRKRCSQRDRSSRSKKEAIGTSACIADFGSHPDVSRDTLASDFSRERSERLRRTTKSFSGRIMTPNDPEHSILSLCRQNSQLKWKIDQ